MSVCRPVPPPSQILGLMVYGWVWKLTKYTLTGGPQGQWGEAPVKKSAVIGIADFREIFIVGQGLANGRYLISPRWGENTLSFDIRSIQTAHGSRTFFGRTHCKLVLSADGSTLTEIGLAVLPGTPFAVTCNISGTFHRQGKK